MKDLFNHYYSYSEAELENAWKNCHFVFDANVILDLYRLPQNASKDLLKIFKSKNFKNRLWMPFQAALEYQENRLSVISDQHKKYDQVVALLDKTFNSISENKEDLKSKLAELQLEKRHSLIEPDKFIDFDTLLSPVSQTFENFKTELANLKNRQPDIHERDKLRDEVDKIFEGKVGSPPKSQDELNQIYEEGKERYKFKLPPGFRDQKDKEGEFYQYNGIKIYREYGDLLLWKGILNYSSENDIKSIILITGDNKVDWWTMKRGQTLGPRKELINEITNSTPVEFFHMYNVYGFMKFAKKYVKVDVKQESIKQAKDISELRLARFGPTHEYRIVEEAVMEWLKTENSECSVYFNRAFPDLTVEDKYGKKIGYEVKLIPSRNSLMFFHRIRDIFYRGYYLTNNEELQEFKLVAVIDDEFEFDKISQRLRKMQLEGPMETGSIIFGKVINRDSEKLKPKFIPIKKI